MYEMGVQIPMWRGSFEGEKRPACDMPDSRYIENDSAEDSTGM